MTLASKHGDGRVVGRVMEKFGFNSILGSTQGGRKSSRGIGIDAIRQIFSGLKKGGAIGITPDGPRGPNQKINGEVLNIARISGAKILIISSSTSKSKIVNSWDKFKIPLPFSKLVYLCHDELFTVDKKLNKNQLNKLKLQIEKTLDDVQNQSHKLANNSNLV